jgi:hypothetical protein
LLISFATDDHMPWIICIIFDRDTKRLLLIEQGSSGRFWFPFGEIHRDENPNSQSIARRIASQVRFLITDRFFFR